MIAKSVCGCCVAVWYRRKRLFTGSCRSRPCALNRKTTRSGQRVFVWLFICLFVVVVLGGGGMLSVCSVRVQFKTKYFNLRFSVIRYRSSWSLALLSVGGYFCLLCLTVLLLCLTVLLLCLTVLFLLSYCPLLCLTVLFVCLTVLCSVLVSFCLCILLSLCCI